LRLNLTAGAALADHMRQEIAEAIVQPLDVRQHPHARMVRSGGERVYSVPEARGYWVSA